MGTRIGKHCRSLLAASLVVGGAIGTSVVGGSPPASATSVVHGNAHGGGASSAASPARRIGRTPSVGAGAVSQGALADTTAIHADVELQPPDPSALASFATAVSTPGNPLYRHYITPSQFTRQFGPTTAAVSAVEKQLTARGLTVGRISANHLTLPVSGPAANFERAFSTGFERYRLAGGRSAYANTEAPLLPGTVAGNVQGVIGLDDLTVPKPLGLQRATTPRPAKVSPHVVTGGPQPCSTAVSLEDEYGGVYTADQIASAYNFSGLYQDGDEGAGITVGLFELEPDSPSDISAYQSCYGTSATVTYTEEDGGAGTGAGQGEAALDIEGIISLAPEASIDVFQAPNTDAGVIDDYTGMVDDPSINVVSTSWGLCEVESDSPTISAEGTLFEQAATEGQSVFAAAGDDGSTGCMEHSLGVDDPSSQPYVTSVGGTSMTSITGPVQTVWNDSDVNVGAGGGGVSSLYPMPSYQSGAPASLSVINANSSGGPCGAPTGAYCREVPDVSASADPYYGYLVYWDGGWIQIGGTSAAAPLWAAFTALTDDSSTCDGTSIGFANPVLYDAAAADYSTNFDDITSGNNDYTPDGYSGGLYPAGTAYDMASGLGTPNGASLPAALCSAAGLGGFRVTTSTLPSATPGTAYGPVTLQETGAGTSVSPYVTSIKWKKVTLPKGLTLSSAGVLSGTLNKKVAAGPSSVTVQVTETVTTLNGKRKAKTVTTVGATIPLTIT